MMPAVPPPPADTALRRRLARWLRVAWAVVLVERLWPLLVPPVCVAGVVVAYALFDPTATVPGWLHLAVMGGGGVAVAALLVRAALRLSPPDGDAAARRLERDCGLDHRPLAVLADRPAGDDAVAGALWRLHLRRTLDRIGPLRVGFPRSDMAARDPWGLRAAVLLLLVVALTGAWGDVSRRLSRAVDGAALRGLAPDTLEVWLTPPLYTGQPPRVLRPAAADPVVVPAGTAVLAVLSGGWGDARLRLAERTLDFQRQPDGGQRIEADLTRSGRLTVRQGLLTVAAWPVTVVADAPPQVAFAQPPEGGERGRLRLALTASDDYGLARVWVTVRRLGLADDGAPAEVELPLAGTPRGAEPTVWADLTGHPWAGLPVTMTPMAADGAGQRAAGPPLTLTLPERSFADPVAAAVVRHRRALSENPAAEADITVDFLDRLGDDPAGFNDDLRTFLMLRLARHALAGRDGFFLAEVQDLLWQAALRIEDGDQPAAERALAEARAALEAAIDRGAGAEELRALLAQFRQAMDRVLRSLSERSARSDGPARPDGAVVGDDELRDMVDQLAELADAGARDALREALGQMSRLLDGLRPGGGGGAAGEGLRRLRDLAERQQRLLDDGRAAGRDAATAARAQQDLHRALAATTRDLVEALGGMPDSIPDSLGEAARAMDGAADQLRHGDWAGAAGLQAQAVSALRRAAQDAQDRMGDGAAGAGMAPRDPLGRPARGAGVGDDGATHVPGAGDLQQSRRVLEEIRRRAADPQRPEPERDYLRRLLRLF